MAILFDQAMLRKYAKNDTILNLLNSYSDENDISYTSHRWLLDSLPKRMIYMHAYGDMLDKKGLPQKILDVGGGYTGLTKILLNQHNYTLLDIMAHDNHDRFRQLVERFSKNFWINKDWYEFQPVYSYEVVVANDLFPNVDQRLAQFIDKYIPFCKEIRISLTYYNEPQFYKVKRVDTDEVLHFLAWDGFQVAHALERYKDRMYNFQPPSFMREQESLFANKRQVAMVSIRGDIV